jgi:hypothetical protein
MAAKDHGINLSCGMDLVLVRGKNRQDIGCNDKYEEEK